MKILITNGMHSSIAALHVAGKISKNCLRACVCASVREGHMKTAGRKNAGCKKISKIGKKWK